MFYYILKFQGWFFLDNFWTPKPCNCKSCFVLFFFFVVLTIWRIFTFFYKSIGRNQKIKFSGVKLAAENESVIYFIVSTNFVDIFAVQILLEFSIYAYDNP